jgi:PAS domain S-box-containing protein
MLSLPDYPVRQRDFLLEISRAITSRLDTGEVLRRVLRASVVMTVGRVGLIALRDEKDDQFYVRAFTGVQREAIPQIDAYLHEIIESATPDNFYEYLNAKLSEMAVEIDDTLRQSVAMPLIFDKKPLGLLIVFRSYEAEVTQNDLQILHSFADQAAIAVHNAQLYERIENERKRLSALLQYSGDGVMILDAHLTVLQVNKAFEHMTAWSGEDVVGCHVTDVIRWDALVGEDLPDAIDAGWPQPQTDNRSDTLYVEGDLARRDGLALSIGITYAPLFDNDSQLATIIANIRDITNFRKAQEMQNVFISTISHELRTPVALIKGYANTLNREDARWDVNVVRNSLGIIEEEADRLTVLIDDLLTASKIQAERDVQLALDDVRLDQMAQQAIERFRTQSPNHQFVFSFVDHFPAIAGDAKLLRQVLDNLLTNAIKYSPEGGTVTIGGRYNEQDVKVFVRDEGVGISEAEQAHVFDRFYRVDNNLTSKTKGTGLGLYLVKAIIEAHGGEIHVKSQPSHGSTFYFSLPRDEPA